MKRTKLFMLLMVLIAISGCEHKSIDKQEADNIVTRYVKKNFKAKDDIYRCVYYYNKLENDRMELTLLDNEENIVAENAFLYYIDEDLDSRDMHPFRIILVRKNDGKYIVHRRSHSGTPLVLPLSSTSWQDWTPLFGYLNGEQINY